MSVTSEMTASVMSVRFDADSDVWAKAYAEACRRGAGANVARFYADQTVTYLRRDRDGVAIAGSGDYQSYR